MQLIDKQVAIKKIHEEFDECLNIDESGEQIACEVENILDTIPTIQSKVGEWIDMGDFEQCSVCTGTHLKEFQTYYGKAIWIRTPYCHNCGAKMKVD